MGGGGISENSPLIRRNLNISKVKKKPDLKIKKRKYNKKKNKNNIISAEIFVFYAFLYL